MPLPRFGGVTLCATNRGKSGGLTTNVSQPVPTLEGCRNDRWQMQKRDTTRARWSNIPSVGFSRVPSNGMGDTEIAFEFRGV